MKRLLLCALVIVGVSACSDETTARRVLEQDGYKAITLTGYSWHCSDKDTFATGFEATNLAGRRVKGAVCSGLWFKGNTIRFQ